MKERKDAKEAKGDKDAKEAKEAKEAKASPKDKREGRETIGRFFFPEGKPLPEGVVSKDTLLEERKRVETAERSLRESNERRAAGRGVRSRDRRSVRPAQVL